MEDYEVAVGDTVLEYHGGRRATNGTVTKIGPKLVHVEASYGAVTTYLKDTQQRRDGYPGHFMTLRQRSDKDREQAARELLRAHGLQIDWGTSPSWTVEQLERLTEAVVAIRNPPALAN